MDIKRRRSLIYGLLFGVWVLVVGWQVEEHSRVEGAAKGDLRNRSQEIANTLSAVMRAMRFRGAVLQERLEPVLNELVNGHTNELVNSSGLSAVALLNTAGEPVVAAGNTNLMAREVLSEGEHWAQDSVTFVNPIEGASVNPESTSNAVVVLPPLRDFTNGSPRGSRESQRRESRTDETNATDVAIATNASGTNAASEEVNTNEASGAGENRSRSGPRRPPWMRGMPEAEFKALIARRELHGLVLTMSTEGFEAVCTHDLWLRAVIIFFASISAVGAGLAWHNTTKTSELQTRLVRASELNSHLKEMNLAAAGLAHETRNPLNIIRGMAQMLSRQTDAPADIREKSRVIVEETDKVTAQLTEFINYSRPREIRRAQVDLNAAINEVVRTLDCDIAEKKIRVETIGEQFSIEADEQMLRQVLFNLLLNATQAVGANSAIQVVTRRSGSAEATLDIRDDGPGVSPENRQEIFKPYFTTHQKGTGLGLAVVHQIVLAHGWEIACVPNEPRGAIFRITHLKAAT